MWPKRIAPKVPSDDELIGQYRERFRCGPVGVWSTSLGAGWDISYGFKFEFSADFTGRAYSCDTGNEEEPERKTQFTWKLIGDFTIETLPVGEVICAEDWGVIRYDFRFSHSKYGGDRMLVLYQLDHHVKGEPGFWWSPNPVVLSNPT